MSKGAEALAEGDLIAGIGSKKKDNSDVAFQLEDIQQAAQQRYSRSPMGFDALLARIPYFRETPPSQWSPSLLDAVVIIVEIATVDVLSHIIGHFDATNLGIEILIELLALCF